jgi:hypothetical protein
MPKTDPRIDAYIAKSPEYAHPILEHLRDLVHKAAPEAEETIKWGMPFFTLNGIILCNMAAFKQHCSFGLWGPLLTAKLKADGIAEGGSNMGSFGRIASLKDLPKDKDLVAYIRAGAAEVSSGKRTVSYKRPARKAAKPVPATPPDLAAALKKNKAAQKAFDGFPPSHRREYIEWITEAKREETRQKRITTTVEWLVEGKSRNWKYE